MPVATVHLLRESLEGLVIILFVQSACWYLLRRSHLNGRRALLPPLAFFLLATWYLVMGIWSEDIRSAELLILLVGVVIPANAFARMSLKRGSLSRGAGLVVVLAPVLTVAWLVVHGFVIPSIACAEHEAAHRTVHRQWALEYRALLELERMRSQHTGQSRLIVDELGAVAPAQIEVLEAAGPDGGWAYTATARDCDNCRSFYLDSNDLIRSARRRRATRYDITQHWNEVEYLREVLAKGCYVLGDVLCRF